MGHWCEERSEEGRDDRETDSGPKSGLDEGQNQSSLAQLDTDWKETKPENKFNAKSNSLY